MIQLRRDSIQEEMRLRSFVEAQHTFSETAASLAVKLNVNPLVARRVLNRYVQMRIVHRRIFEPGIEPVYYRYRRLAP